MPLNKFVTMVNSNKECHVAVKTPWGSLTERKVVKDIEMQGTIISSLKCSVQIDALGPECLKRTSDIYYYYLLHFERVRLPLQSNVHDILSKLSTIIFWYRL